VCKTTKNFISTSVLTPSGLSLNAVQRSNGNLRVRVLHSDQSGPIGMLELMVRTFDSSQIPAIFLKALDDLFAVHANCTELVGISNTKFNVLKLGDQQCYANCVNN
jgi:hypothetical protein